MIIATYTYSLLTFLVILFQVALLLGMPWGEYTLGGKYPGKLPIQGRFLVVFQIAVLLIFWFLVLAKSGIAFETYQVIGKSGIWVVVVFFVLGSVANFITKSKKERMVMFPTNVVMLICSLIVAVS
ncbi:hypothetical protein [Raineya sp.]|jgi:hypothetical protein